MLSGPSGGIFDFDVLHQLPGSAVLSVTGNGEEALLDEAGGHRWQRIPPTERRGRVHTSTITVAVLTEVGSNDIKLSESELEWKTSRGHGPGGQNRNKLETAVQLRHLPTGISVQCCSERSQHRNKQIAARLLRCILKSKQDTEAQEKENLQRQTQIGSGMRGDKRRTIRVRDNQVKDHITGRIWRYSDYVVGDW